MVYSYPVLRSILFACTITSLIMAMHKEKINNKDLRKAAFLGKREKVEEQLLLGVNPNTIEPFGMAPIHYAAQQGHADIITLLCSKGASPNLPTLGSETPLFIAYRHNHINCIEALLAYPDTNPAAMSKRGEQLIHIAAAEGNEQVVALLLKRKECDIDCRDKESWTALHWSTCMRQKKTVALLLDNGADPGIPSKELSLPLHIATSDRFEEGIQIIMTRYREKIPNNASTKMRDSYKLHRMLVSWKLPLSVIGLIYSYIPESIFDCKTLSKVVTLLPENYDLMHIIYHCPYPLLRSATRFVPIHKQTTYVRMVASLEVLRRKNKALRMLAAKDTCGDTPLDEAWHPESGSIRKLLSPLVLKGEYLRFKMFFMNNDRELLRSQRVCYPLYKEVCKECLQKK